MSLILQVRENSPVFTLPNKKAVRFYFYLLSIARTVNERQLVSQLITPMSAEDKSLVRALVEEGFVEDDGGGFIIVAESKELLANHVHPFLREIETVQGYHDEVARRKNRIRAEGVEQWLQLLPSLQHYKQTIKSPTDVKRVWQQMYGLVFERDSRPFNGKELGQFNHLVKYYDVVMSVKMVIKYLIENDSPSIGHLLTLKDGIFHEIHKTDKATKTTTSTSGNEFF